MGKSWLQKFLDKLAVANEKEYGNEAPECCGEGKNKKQAKQERRP